MRASRTVIVRPDGTRIEHERYSAPADGMPGAPVLNGDVWSIPGRPWRPVRAATEAELALVTGWTYDERSRLPWHPVCAVRGQVSA